MRRIMPFLVVGAILFALLGTGRPAQAAGVVTDCSTQAGLEAALSGGGLVTFSCGVATITITSTIEIRAADVTIDGGGQITLQGTPGVRMILHRSWYQTASNLTIKNLTINGASVQGVGENANGAAIRSVNNSVAPPAYAQTLNVSNVTFSNNISNQTGSGGFDSDYGGGAIFTQGGYLNVTDCEFTNNIASHGAGGAIHVLRSNMSILRTTFTTNSATPTLPGSGTGSGYGGALYVDGALPPSNGYITIRDSVFSGNNAANQGGVAYVNLYTQEGESLTVDRSRFTNNTVSGGGMGMGGVFSGGGTDNGGGAARITITNSFFAYNSASGGATGASGGALGFAQTAHTVIANSTFYDNEARGLCTNCYNANGGAIYIVNNPVAYKLYHNTFVNNHADWVGGAVTANTNGELRGNIFANNTASNGGNPWNIQQNCGMTVTTGSNNLQWPALHPTDGNDRICAPGTPIVNPNMGTPGDNGGPTFTLPPLTGSPAINAGNNSYCTSAPLNNLDQRGLVRVTTSNPTCDIGAFEVNGTAPGDTVGIFRPSTSAFYLRNANTTGPADLTTVIGAGTDLPVTGDWDGDGVDTVGVYRPTTGQFFLRNSNASGAPVIYIFTFGAPGDLPFAGDWNNDGRDGVGVFRNGRIYLRNALSTGAGDYSMLLGTTGDKPVAGDWNSDGTDSPGLYRPSTSAFFLTNQLCNCAAAVNHGLTLGNPNDVPLAGDWDGNGAGSVGVFRPTNGRIFLRNALTTGYADTQITYGIANDRPVAGKWAVPPSEPPEPSALGAAPIFSPGR